MSCHSMDAHDSFIAQDSASVRGDDLANSLLNFATGPDDLELQGVKRQKSARDPMSHRIIEKRRRDRMNNCLADLSRLIPTSYLKQGQGRIEKTEIIEMAIKHIKTLQAQVDSSQNVNYNMTSMKRDTGTSIEGGHMLEHSCCGDQFYQGFKECQDETLRYMVEGEAMVASDPFCVRVMDHLSNVAQRFDLSCIRGEDKKEVVMDVEGQQPMSGTPSFSGSSANTPLPSLEPMLPLLPTSGGMLMPASPVRNKQLRNLLSARALQQLEAEREACTPHNPDHKGSSGGEAGSTATSTVLHPVLSVCSAPSMSMDTSASLGLGHCDNSMNGSGTSSSGYMSDTSAMDRFSNGSVMSSAGVGELMAHTRDSSAVNAYKFKHSITKRFSQEGKAVAQQYDGSSSASSREAEDEHPHHSFLKQRATKTKNKYASSSDSGPYPTSDLSGATSVSSHESADGGALDRNGGRKVGVKGASDVHNPTDAECCSRSAMPLPGFVLHPSGTHYMPMSVCYSNIPDLYDSGKDPSFGPPVFHPISIPVHFRGPVISVPGSSIHNQNAIAVKSADSASASPKDTKGIKKLQG